KNGGIIVALKMNFLASTGVMHHDAYIKVFSYTCDVENTINARLRAYASRQHAMDGLSHLEGSEDIISFNGDYSALAKNAKTQIYEHAKTIERYSNSVDILE